VRLALCAEVIDHLDFAAQCAFAKAVGYDGLELEPQRLSEIPHLLPASRRGELRRIAADHGLQITGFHSLLYVPPGLSITSGDLEVRRHSLDVIERLCNLCADLGGSYIVHGSADQRRLSSETADDDRRRGIEAFHFGAEVAMRLGLRYLIEPIRPSRTNFVNTIAEAAGIARASASASLATMLDCLSADEAEDEPLPALLDRWLPTGLIAHVHLNDRNRRGPGQGEMKFAGIIGALKRHAYDGWVSVEPFVFEPSGEAVAARAAGYVRGMLEAIQ
jgi:D-psicose/D-tagatose/L-ribulose 3-epimerase